MATATVMDVVNKAYTKVNGEFEAQVEGSDDFKTYLNVLNQIMDDLAHTPYIKWQIFFNPNFNVGTVINNVLSYTITGMGGLTIGDSPFDYVYFDLGGTVVARYKIVDAAMFQSTSNTQVCMVAGNSLYLKGTESKIIGATIRIPVYVDPTPYTTAAQTVTIDSIPWLVYSIAAFICDSSPVPFIARNADKFQKQADIKMKEMRATNRRNQALMIKKLGGAQGRTWQDVMNVMTIREL